MISNYDKRQVLLLKKHIKYFREGNMDLYNFVNRTDSILNAMENVDKHWINNIHNNWVELEIVLACALSNPEKPIDEDDVETVNISVKQMDELTDQYMKENQFSLQNDEELTM